MSRLVAKGEQFNVEFLAERICKSNIWWITKLQTYIELKCGAKYWNNFPVKTKFWRETDIEIHDEMYKIQRINVFQQKKKHRSFRKSLEQKFMARLHQHVPLLERGSTFVLSGCKK